MRRFIIENDVFEMFPELEIGVLTVKGIKNNGEGKGELLEKVCKELYEKLLPLEEMHKDIKTYSMAMKKFKTKKGAKASIEAMTARIKKGHILGSISPLVDI